MPIEENYKNVELDFELAKKTASKERVKGFDPFGTDFLKGVVKKSPIEFGAILDTSFNSFLVSIIPYTNNIVSNFNANAEYASTFVKSVTFPSISFEDEPYRRGGRTYHAATDFNVDKITLTCYNDRGYNSHSFWQSWLFAIMGGQSGNQLLAQRKFPFEYKSYIDIYKIDRFTDGSNNTGPNKGIFTVRTVGAFPTSVSAFSMDWDSKNAETFEVVLSVDEVEFYPGKIVPKISKSKVSSSIASYNSSSSKQQSAMSFVKKADTGKVTQSESAALRFAKTLGKATSEKLIRAGKNLLIETEYRIKDKIDNELPQWARIGDIIRFDSNGKIIFNDDVLISRIATSIAGRLSEYGNSAADAIFGGNDPNSYEAEIDPTDIPSNYTSNDRAVSLIAAALASSLYPETSIGAENVIKSGISNLQQRSDSAQSIISMSVISNNNSNAAALESLAEDIIEREISSMVYGRASF